MTNNSFQTKKIRRYDALAYMRNNYPTFAVLRSYSIKIIDVYNLLR